MSCVMVSVLGLQYQRKVAPLSISLLADSVYAMMFVGARHMWARGECHSSKQYSRQCAMKSAMYNYVYDALLYLRCAVVFKMRSCSTHSIDLLLHHPLLRHLLRIHLVTHLVLSPLFLHHPLQIHLLITCVCNAHSCSHSHM